MHTTLYFPTHLVNSPLAISTHALSQKSLLELHGKLKSLFPGSERTILRAANICFHLAASGSAGGRGEREREDECVMWSNHADGP